MSTETIKGYSYDEKKDEIGRGALGTIFRARHIQDPNNEVAIKVIDHNKGPARRMPKELKERELEICKAILNESHENLVSLIDYEVKLNTTHLIMEFCGGGDFRGYLEDEKTLRESVIQEFFWQIVSGLKFLHDRDIVHRDLKPENILLSFTGEVVTGNRYPIPENIILKIADFGLSRFLSSDDVASTECGTLVYMAPEILQRKPYSKEVDVWSIGVMVQECLLGKVPNPTYRNSNTLPAETSKAMRALLQKLMAQKPQDRLNCGQILQHEFMRAKSRSVGNRFQRREILVGLLVKEREAEYTRLTNYRVFCGTWDVNGQIPSEKLHKWLSPEEDKDNPPDIYAIGFQELDLSKNVYFFNDSAREDEWLHKVEDALHPKAKYKKVRLIRLVAMMLVVFVKSELYDCIRELLSESVGTGLLGVMGNKGGVAIRFRLHDSTICFVNSHFAARTEEYERRNQDFREISCRLNFRSGETQSNITDHDIVFWLGNLNYRICDMDSDECKRMIQTGKLEELMNYDQLIRYMTLKRVFLDYFEGEINFIPTYKYDTGTDNWDSSDKCQTPAWCDRVLWRGSKYISQLAYRSHPQLKLSNHKPVSAVFNVGFKTYDLTLERKVREEVMKLLDQKEKEFLPQLSPDVPD